MAQLGIRTLRRPDRPRRPARHAGRASRTGRRRASTTRPRRFCPNRPAEVPRLHRETQDHGSTKALDRQARRPRQTGAGKASKKVIACRSATSTARGRDAVGRGGAKRWPCRPARTTPSTSPQRHRRAELRRLPGSAASPRAGGRGNDYVGKGLSGGRIVVRPSPEFHGERRRTSSSATPCSTARPRAVLFPPVSRASASRCAIPAPPRSWRAWATTAAST